MNVRAPFQDTLDFFQENGRDIHNFPFLLQHPNAELVGILHQQQPEAEVEHSTLQRLLENLSNKAYSYVSIQMGSLCHPESITCRYAAYSIILDTCVDDEERAPICPRMEKHRCVSTYSTKADSSSNHLRPVYLSFGSFLQLYVFVRCSHGACIYTDSMAAIKFFSMFFIFVPWFMISWHYMGWKTLTLWKDFGLLQDMVTLSFSKLKPMYVSFQACLTWSFTMQWVTI